MAAITNSDNILAGSLNTQVLAIEAEEMYIPFDPIGQDDGRERVLRDVVQRRGQPKFRNSLIKAYKGRCAITNCSILSILEAAHITPYLGPTTNAVSNGLLLRADIHTLWDLALIAVEPAHQTIWVSPTIGDAEYRALAGKLLCEPSEPMNRPSLKALKEQWDLTVDGTE
jgi:predicted restriction endonuclease